MGGRQTSASPWDSASPSQLSSLSPPPGERLTGEGHPQTESVGRCGDASTKAGPTGQTEKEQSDCQDLLSPGAGAMTRESNGDREQPRVQ